MARILLAGCGNIGTQLGGQLQAEGHEVFGLRRSNADMPFPCLQADLTQPLPDTLLPQNLDYVVHTGTPSERSDAGYEAGYPRAVANLLAALTQQSLKRYFFVSSTAVYHQDDGSWVDETSRTEPLNYNGVRVLEAETMLQRSNIPATSIRFGGIYGSGRNWLIRRVQNGAEAQAGPPKYTNRIHQDDCVGALKFLITENEQGRSLHPVYVGVDDDPATEADVCTWLAQQLNAPPPTLITATTPASQNKRCRNNLLKLQGYAFIFPSFRDGYQAIIDSF